MNRLMTIYLSFMFILAMNMTSVLSVKAFLSMSLHITCNKSKRWNYKLRTMEPKAETDGTNKEGRKNV